MNPISPLIFDAVVRSAAQAIAAQALAHRPRPVEAAKRPEPKTRKLAARPAPGRKAARAQEPL